MAANVYYNPEKFGLEVVAELEFGEPNYSFDTRVVWKDTDGILYTARDSGCSCPTPFEDFHSIAELERVDMRFLEDEIRDSSEWCRPDPDDAAAFLAKVEKALHG